MAGFYSDGQHYDSMADKKAGVTSASKADTFTSTTQYKTPTATPSPAPAPAPTPVATQTNNTGNSTANTSWSSTGTGATSTQTNNSNTNTAVNISNPSANNNYVSTNSGGSGGYVAPPVMDPNYQTSNTQSTTSNAPTTTIGGILGYDNSAELARLQAEYKKQQEDYARQQAEIQKQIANTVTTQKQALAKQKQDMEQQLLSLRDVADQFGVPIDYQNGQVMIDGQAIDPTKFGMKNVNGRFVGNPDQVASAFGLAPVRGSFEGNGAQVGYENGLISINGINFDPEAEGAVNIGGHFYAHPSTIESMNSRAGGDEFNPKSEQQQQQVQTKEQVVQQTAQEQRVQKLNDNIEFLQNELKRVEDKPPEDSSDQIKMLIDGLKSYQGIYTEDVGSLIKQTLSSEFSYSPENDSMLKDAASYASSQIMEQMNARGILNSSVTGDKFAQMYKELMPQYYNLAYQRYNDKLNNTFKKLEIMNKLNEQDYDKYYQFATLSINQIEKLDAKAYTSFKDNLSFIDAQLSRAEKAKTDEMTLQEKKIANAYERLNTLGYVDNEASLVLGLPVNTPSGVAKTKAEERLFQLKRDQSARNETFKENKLKRKEKLEDLQILKDEKKAESDKKIELGKIMAGLSTMPGEKQREFIIQNLDRATELVGDNLPELIKNINTVVDKDQTEKNNDIRLAATLSSQERSANNQATVAGRAADAANRAIDNDIYQRTKTDNDNQVKDYESYIDTTYFDKYQGITSLQEGKTTDDIVQDLSQAQQDGRISDSTLNRLANKYGLHNSIVKK